jgi:membrane fusion protein, multidrug efflux system
VEQGKLVRKPVKLGATLRDQGLVQLAEGLAPGAQVVRNNLGLLREGSAVRVAGPDAKSR